MLLLSLLFLLCVKYCLTLNTMPVFLIDYVFRTSILDSIKSQTNPFARTNSKDFEAITNQTANQSKNIVLFIEQMFSMEDISCKDNQGTPYVHLHKYFLENKVKYFPKVEEPYKLIAKKFESFDFNTFHIKDTMTRFHIDEHYKFIYVYFEDNRNETRVQTLRRHDSMMREMLFVIKQLVKGPVTAMYTGLRNPINMKSESRRIKVSKASKEARRSNNFGWLTVQCANGTFSFYDGKLLNGFDAKMMPRSCYRSSDRKAGSFTYNVVFDSMKNDVVLKTYELIFYFTFQENPAAGWNLNQIQWTKKNHELGKLDLKVTHPWDKFYRSRKPLSITPSEWFDPTLVLTSFKILISIKSKVDVNETTPVIIDDTTPEVIKDTTREAHSSEETTADIPTSTNYVDWEIAAPDLGPQSPHSNRKRPLHVIMTAPLLSALLISLILLSILGWGLNMLMYVQGSDRYDSHEKKVLSVADITD